MGLIHCRKSVSGGYRTTHCAGKHPRRSWAVLHSLDSSPGTGNPASLSSLTVCQVFESAAKLTLENKKDFYSKVLVIAGAPGGARTPDLQTAKTQKAGETRIILNRASPADLFLFTLSKIYLSGVVTNWFKPIYLCLEYSDKYMNSLFAKINIFSNENAPGLRRIFI